MGWWKAEDGSLIGDEPLDLLGDTFEQVREQYRNQHSREPTSAELQHLIELAWGSAIKARVSLQVDVSPRSTKGDAGAPPDELAVGHVLALQLADGRFGVARILDDRGDGHLVEALAGVFDAPPPLETVRGLERLRERRFKHTGDALILLIDDDPPAASSLVGKIPPSAEQRSEQTAVLGDWETVTKAILGEWRWVHDREAFVRETEERKKAAIAKYKKKS